MPKSITCPACQSIISAPGGEPGAAIKCPRCGTKLVAKVRPKAAGEGAGPRSAAGPGAPRRKQRRRPPKKSFIDFLGIGTALGAAVLLLGVSYGLSVVVRLAVGSGGGPPVAAVSTPETPPSAGPGATATPAETPAERAPEPPRWEAAPDPASEPPPAVAAGLGIPLEGDPVLASHDGPFLLDSLPPEATPVRARARSGDTASPVYDLRTGKPAGPLPQGAPRDSHSVLSPDGQVLLGPDKNHTLVEAWRVGSADPVAQLKPPGGVFWMG